MSERLDHRFSHNWHVESWKRMSMPVAITLTLLWSTFVLLTWLVCSQLH